VEELNFFLFDFPSFVLSFYDMILLLSPNRSMFHSASSFVL